MRTSLYSRVVLLACCGVTALVLIPAAGLAANGAGSLFVSGATHTPTHWNIPIGVPTNAEIRGVTTAEAGSPLPATIVVIVKSSVFGNTQLVGTRIGATSNYSFTYTPPSKDTGATFDACETTIVAYISNGNNSNNDLLDDGLQNGSNSSACGFRFVNAQGNPIECNVSTQSATWGAVKTLFQ